MVGLTATMGSEKRGVVSDASVPVTVPGPAAPVPGPDAFAYKPPEPVSAPVVVPSPAERIAALEMENASLRARLGVGAVEMLGVQTRPAGTQQCYICKGAGCALCGQRGWNK